MEIYYIMKHSYHDKHGNEILAGMTIRYDDGDVELVYAITDGSGDEDLGIMATNPDYVKHHPNCEIKYYSLSSIGTREWEIVQ